MARAQGARRMLPWATGSAALAGILVGLAGGGWRGGLAVGLLGLGFAGFAAAASLARCPACGGSLVGLASERAGRRGPAPSNQRRCPRCKVVFE